MPSESHRKKVLALEWNPRTLRVVHASWRKKRAHVDRVLSVEITSDVDMMDPASLGRFIRGILDDQGISTRHAVVDIARDQSILTTLMLPASAKDEMPSMVEFQIARELPFAVSDATIDFAAPLAQAGEELVPVTVAAVRNEYLDFLKAVCQAAGLKLDRIGLRPFANKLAVCRMFEDAMPERILFVDVGPSLSEIDVFTADALAFSRAASVLVPLRFSETRNVPLRGGGDAAGAGPRGEPGPGSQAGEAGETGAAAAGPVIRPLDEGPAALSIDSVVSQLVVEVTRSVEAYRTSDRGAAITHAVVAGDLGVEEALAEAIGKRFAVQVDIYNAASSFGWTADEGAAAAGFSAVLGLIIGQGVDPQVHFDFLHPKRTVTQTQVRLRKAPRLVAWAALVAAALGIVYWAQFSPQRQRIRELQADINALNESKREKEDFIKLVGLVDDFDRKQPIWIDELYDLVTALPGHEALVLNQIDMSSQDRRFMVKTRAKDQQTAPQVRDTLDNFVRPGASQPRFDAWVGPQQEGRQGEKYPYFQDFLIHLLRDNWKPPTASGPSAGDSAGEDAGDDGRAEAGPRPGAEAAPETPPPPPDEGQEAAGESPPAPDSPQTGGGKQ